MSYQAGGGGRGSRQGQTGGVHCTAPTPPHLNKRTPCNQESANTPPVSTQQLHTCSCGLANTTHSPHIAARPRVQGRKVLHDAPRGNAQRQGVRRLVHVRHSDRECRLDNTTESKEGGEARRKVMPTNHMQKRSRTRHTRKHYSAPAQQRGEQADNRGNKHRQGTAGAVHRRWPTVLD